MTIKVGDRVRITGYAGVGGYGRVVEIRSEPNRSFPNGMVYVRRELDRETGIYPPEAVVTVTQASEATPGKRSRPR